MFQPDDDPQGSALPARAGRDVFSPGGRWAAWI